MNCPHCHSEIPNEAVFYPHCNMGIEEQKEPSDYHYAAFISYRHLPRDTKVAKQVQEAIETYHLPRSIQKAKDNNPDAVKTDRTSKLGKCFRDEDELAASHSLPESIQTALTRSHSLIVICSPETKESAWVRREIETFAALHGRERIICVLAEGDSTDAIPEILKAKFQPDAEGIMREMPAEPLAADLRPANKAKQKAELLRIIAAVAGCNFDDLKQRDKNRRNKRIVTGSAVVLLLAILIGFIAYQASQNSEEALIANSKALAAQAQEQLARGERIQAVETALSALPSSEENPNRPLVEEAQTALEDALGVNQESLELWKPNFAYDAQSDIASFASSRNGDWVAVLDSNGSIEILDIYTRVTRCQIDLKDHANDSESFNANEWQIESAGQDRFIVANHYGKGSIACFSTSDGSMLWERPNAVVSAMALSDDEESCVLFTANEDGSVLAGLIETRTGNVLSTIQTPPGYSYDFGIAPPCSYNRNENIACIAYGPYACAFFFDEETFQPVTFDGSLLWSIYEAEKIIVGASADKRVDNSTLNDTTTRPFYFSARSISTDEPKNLWEKEGIFAITVDGDPHQAIAYEGSPRIQCLAQERSLSAVCTAGGTLDIISLKDGSSIYQNNFDQSIVEVGTMYGGENDYLVLALSDGTLDLIMPLEPASAHGTSFKTQIPYQVDQASISNKNNGLTVALLHAANQPERLLSYSFDAVNIDDRTTYSLDELLKMAHQLVD